ncbi:unknown protein [Cronobacter turicensis z3032]|uniref:Uncharacterized protein n=1 Tax=Cronobacter turicensis (strain DSM 18703 / CCUG 55852 / LMG 23827 / z3032) TaxID=693216 RepID=C9Y520_CROTZ|nr:unknown protein [Cronobacter turicensis z3032]
MKYLLILFIWFIIFITSLKSMYFFIPATAQYALAESIGNYGDESVMDFILYFFTCFAIVISSFVLYLLLRFIRRR